MFKDSVDMCVYHVNVWNIHPRVVCVCMYVECVVCNVCLCVKCAPEDIFTVCVCVCE